MSKEALGIFGKDAHALVTADISTARSARHDAVIGMIKVWKANDVDDDSIAKLLSHTPTDSKEVEKLIETAQVAVPAVDEFKVIVSDVKSLKAPPPLHFVQTGQIRTDMHELSVYGEVVTSDTRQLLPKLIR